MHSSFQILLSVVHSQNIQEKPVYISYCGLLSYDTYPRCSTHLVGEL